MYLHRYFKSEFKGVKLNLTSQFSERYFNYKMFYLFLLFHRKEKSAPLMVSVCQPMYVHCKGPVTWRCVINSPYFSTFNHKLKICDTPSKKTLSLEYFLWNHLLLSGLENILRWQGVPILHYISFLVPHHCGCHILFPFPESFGQKTFTNSIDFQHFLKIMYSIYKS